MTPETQLDALDRQVAMRIEQWTDLRADERGVVRGTSPNQLRRPVHRYTRDYRRAALVARKAVAQDSEKLEIVVRFMSGDVLAEVFDSKGTSVCIHGTSRTDGLPEMLVKCALAIVDRREAKGTK